MKWRRGHGASNAVPLTRRERESRAGPVHGPGMRRFALGLVGAVALAAVVGGLMLAARVLPGVVSGPQLRVLQVEGDLHHVSVDAVREAVAGDVRGRGFFRVNLDRIQREIEAMPWVASASVRRSWPHTVVVRVLEQVPVAGWDGLGLVNAAGQVFVQRAPQRPNLPQLAGPDGSSARVLRTFEQMSSVLENDGLKVHTLTLNPRGGWRLLLGDGIEVRLGRDDPQARLDRFAHIVVQALNRKLDQIKYVDMRYTNGFAVGWKAVAETHPPQHGEEVPDV